MAVEDARRIELVERLAASIGPEATATMFDLLPGPDEDHVVQRELQGLNGRLDGFIGDVDRRFAEIDQRFDDVDRRFAEVDRRFAEVDRRFDEVDHRFELVDQRFAEVDRRFDEVDHRFELVDQRFDAMDLKLDALGHQLLAAFRGELVTAVSGQTRAVIVATGSATFGIGGLAVTLAQLL